MKVAVLAFGLLRCGTEATLARPTVRPPASDAAMPTEMGRALARVEGLRGLSARKQISGKYISRGELHRVLREHAAREIPPEALEREAVVLKLLGAIPTAYPFVEKQFEILGGEIAGLYEPSDKTMYLLRDLGPKEAEATLLHELVHALQDDHFGLRKRVRYQSGGGDALAAASALAEGDATYVMMIATGQPPEPAALRTAMAASAQKPGQPAFLSNALISSYVYGYEFVYGLAREGAMAAVNDAWTRPPTTTEQILHPAKWRAGEPAALVAAPHVPQRVDDDSLGEMGLRAYLELGGSTEGAAIAASGWGGDRGALGVDGDTVRYAWHYRADADAPGAASRVMAELNRVFRTLGTLEDTGEISCVSRPDAGPIAAVRKDGDVWLVAGPTSSRTWQSTATCHDARKALGALVRD
jgi:hypothetical protein